MTLACKERYARDAVVEFSANVTDIFCQFSDVWRRMWRRCASGDVDKVRAADEPADDRDSCLPRGFSTRPRYDASPRRLRQPRFWIRACGENDLRVTRATGLSRHP